MERKEPAWREEGNKEVPKPFSSCLLPHHPLDLSPRAGPSFPTRLSAIVPCKPHHWPSPALFLWPAKTLPTYPPEPC